MLNFPMVCYLKKKKFRATKTTVFEQKMLQNGAHLHFFFFFHSWTEEDFENVESHFVKSNYFFLEKNFEFENMLKI